MKKVYEVNLFELEVGNLVLFHPGHGFLLIVQKKLGHLQFLTDKGKIRKCYSNSCTFRLPDKELCYWII